MKISIKSVNVDLITMKGSLNIGKTLIIKKYEKDQKMKVVGNQKEQPETEEKPWGDDMVQTGENNVEDVTMDGGHVGEQSASEPAAHPESSNRESTLNDTEQYAYFVAYLLAMLTNDKENNPEP